MDILIVLARFIVTFLMALIFGVERQTSHKPIGFGTFIFVSIGSCGLAITAIGLGETNPAENPIPLLSAIVTGIGFLGAGALIKTTDRIFGFTTAASIWFFAIIGLIIGVGEYVTAAIMYALIWTTVFYDRYLEKRGIGSYQKKITLTTNKIIDEEEVRDLMCNTRCKLIHKQIDRKDNKMHLQYIVEGTRGQVDEIPKRLMDEDWFDSCKIE